MSDQLPGAAPSAAVDNSSQQSAPLEAAVQNLEAQAADPTLSTTEKKEIQKQIKEYKLKVNGKDKIIKFDPNNDQEVMEYLQKAESSDSKFREASDIRKSAMEFIEQLRKNPRKVLTDPNIGVDIKKFASEILNEELEESTKSPEQREKEKYKRELEELKEKYKKDEDDRKQQDFERLQAEHEQKLESGISSALDSNSLPKTPYTVKKMAEMMMIALQNGIDLTPDDVAPLIRKQMQQEIKEMLSASSDDVLEEFLKDQLPRIRKRNVAKVKNTNIQNANSIKPTANARPEPVKEEKKMTIKEFLKV